MHMRFLHLFHASSILGQQEGVDNNTMIEILYWCQPWNHLHPYSLLFNVLSQAPWQFQRKRKQMYFDHIVNYVIVILEITT